MPLFTHSEGRQAVGWTSGQSNTVSPFDLSISCPSDLVFRRLYLGWWVSQIGDYEVTGEIRLLQRKRVVSAIPFGWAENLVTAVAAGRSNINLWVPGFTVDKRPLGSGNSFPYSLPASPECLVSTWTYTETGTGSATYNLQVTCQPLKLAENFDELLIHFEPRSGTVTGNPGIFSALAAVHSSKLPF